MAWAGVEHQALIAGALALSTAQMLKTFLHFVAERRVDFKVAVATGGMPSSHTALVVSVTATVAFVQGLNSMLFDVCTVFSAIVMYDATGLRQAAGRQAAVVNKMMDELWAERTVKEIRLKELLGHTKLEVLGGALYGALVAVFVHCGW
ncbi:MAG: divergent PAP2 family protein [Candidatus Sericytochromatia bacterium]|nr:divergent PAP2 family protein [Candidatus Sericytochromatia bacterium]